MRISAPTSSNQRGGLRETIPTIRRGVSVAFFPEYVSSGEEDTPERIKLLNGGEYLQEPHTFSDAEKVAQKNLGLFIELPDGTLYWRIRDVTSPIVIPGIEDVTVVGPLGETKN